MKMDFSVGMGRNLRIDEVAGHSQVAEESGFSQVTFIDSQNLCRDVYPMMAIAALSTRRAQIGHGVTTPFTRHPSVTANATATIDELSGGRAFIGIGTGFSAVMTMGMKARPMQELRETIQFLRRYMAGEETEFRGAKMHSEWIRRVVPIIMGSVGPKALQLAGELADGIMFSGVNVEMAKWNIEQVQKGALRAGRDPSDIEMWNRTMIYVAESKEAAFPEVASYAATGMMAKYQALQRNAPEILELRRRLERVEPGILDEINRLADVWDSYQHERTDSTHIKAITQRLVDFIHLTGNEDDISERIDRLGELGIKNISTTVFTIADKKGMMREIGDRIMPNFRN